MSNDLTSVAVRQDTKEKLDDLKDHPNESYESVISRLVEGEPIDSGSERTELVAEIRDQLDRLDSSEPSSDPVDYAEMERRMKRAVESAISQ